VVAAARLAEAGLPLGAAAGASLGGWRIGDFGVLFVDLTFEKNWDGIMECSRLGSLGSRERCCDSWRPACWAWVKLFPNRARGNCMSVYSKNNIIVDGNIISPIAITYRYYECI
jgi:hypothetical protein